MAMTDTENFSIDCQTSTTHKIHSEDQHIVDIIKDAGVDVMIAGGAPLAWYRYQPVGSKDIDIWLKNSNDLKKLSQHLLLNQFSMKFNSANAETLQCQRGNLIWRIQLIKHPRACAEDVIKSFDITVCQIATDGDQWIYTPAFVEDVKSRRLRLTYTHKESPKRLLKYWSYGFQPTDYELDIIINSPVSEWDYTMSSESDYANSI